MILIFLFACEQKSEPKLKVKSKKELRELMISSHKAYLNREKERLDQYTDSLPHSFQQSGSGLRYSVIESSGSNDSIKEGDIAVINYTLLLLNGDTAYQSVEGQPQEFMVEMDDVEAGLHEGIQKIAIGDKAIFVLPAHLAHGLTGDQAAIPIQSPLVYHLELIGKK